TTLFRSALIQGVSGSRRAEERRRNRHGFRDLSEYPCCHSISRCKTRRMPHSRREACHRGRGRAREAAMPATGARANAIPAVDEVFSSSTLSSRRDPSMRITSPRSTASLLLTITAFAVAGCSDTAPSGTSGSAARDLTAVRACDLLTPTDIEMATGIAPGTGEDMTELDGRLPMCNWTPATGGFRPVANLLVTTSSYTDYDEF